jgi:hypothetical protein
VTQSGYVEKVVLVAGGATTDAKWTEVREVSKEAFLTFRSLQLPAANIQYLSPALFEDFDGDGMNDVDDSVGLLNLLFSIETWAADANQLLVYVIGEEQSNGVFRLSSSQFLSASDFDQMLDMYQVSNEVATVVLDFPGSGGYLPVISPTAGAQRTVVASCRTNRTHLLTEDLSFSKFYLNGLKAGSSVGDATEGAQKAILLASGNFFQKASIDDNGDGVPNEKGVDGVASDNIFVGMPFFSGQALPTIQAVLPETFLTNTTSLIVWADGVTDVDGVSNVWVHITPPTNDANTVSIELALTNVTSSTRWEQTYTDFSQAGPYAVTYFAEDGLSNVLARLQTLVVKTDSNNLVVTDPRAADLLEPDSDFSSATPINFPTTRYHTLSASDDSDWVKFYALPDLSYDFRVLPVSGGLDTRLEVYAEVSNGYPIFTNTVLSLLKTVDEFQSDGGEVLGLDFPESGWYYLKVSPAVINTTPPFVPSGYLLTSASQGLLAGITVVVREVGSGVALVGATSYWPPRSREGTASSISPILPNPITGCRWTREPTATPVFSALPASISPARYSPSSTAIRGESHPRNFRPS